MFLILHLSKEGYLTSVACEEGLTRMFCLQGGGVVKVQIKVHIGNFVYLQIGKRQNIGVCLHSLYRVFKFSKFSFFGHMTGYSCMISTLPFVSWSSMTLEQSFQSQYIIIIR